MNECRQVRILMALRENDRSASENHLVHAHLEACAGCARLVRTYQGQDRLLQWSARLDSTTLEWESLRKSICQRKRGWGARLHAGPILRSAAALAAIVVLVFGLNALFQWISQSRSVQPATSSPIATPTETSTPTPVPTHTALPTSTPTETPTTTPVPTYTALPTATPLPTVPISTPPPIAFGYGIQAEALTGLDRVTEAVQDLGLGWLKQQVRWAQIEPAQGAYEWDALDALVESCAQAGINVLLSVAEAPAWARGDKTGYGPPDDPQDLADFVAAVAARYRGRVQAYEIWSEQNMRSAWEGTPLSGTSYVQLLNHAYTAIKAADPDAIVISGGLTPTSIHNGEWASDNLIYLQQMYDAGLKGACDAVGVHASGYANPPDVYYRTGDFDASRVFDDHRCFFFRNALEDTYQVMVENGDGDKMIWVTEFGWGTTDGMGDEPNPGYDFTADIDQAQQADYIVRAYTWAKEWEHADAMFLWNLNLSMVAGPENSTAKYSILYEDGSPRPAYTALKNMPK